MSYYNAATRRRCRNLLSEPRLPFQGLEEIQADLRNAADKCAWLGLESKDRTAFLKFKLQK